VLRSEESREVLQAWLLLVRCNNVIRPDPEAKSSQSA
jgi:hypothetical protein